MASAPAEDVARGRRERRRRLDARRSKCRIRLGGRMERWCRLKERLGFALHSQLAKFLLDRSEGRREGAGLRRREGREATRGGAGPGRPGLGDLGTSPGLCPLQARSLCSPRVCSIWCFCATHTAANVAWHLSCGDLQTAGSWYGSARPATASPGSPHCFLRLRGRPSRPGGADRSLQVWNLSAMGPLQKPSCWGEAGRPEGQASPAEIMGQGRTSGCLTWACREVGPPPEILPPPREEEDENEELLSDASPWSYSSSPDDESDVPRPPTTPATCMPEEGETQTVPTSPEPSQPGSPLHPGAPPTSEAEVQLELKETPQAEPHASPRSQPLPPLTLAQDEDTAQIGPKRIRKAAKKELMPCDFPGCGRIFSNRQYLNHHRKYQHIHQKSFCCPEPACGKSFNFKKHLKEHVKLHSDTRDYICEFCARSFRTSSNLVIHRRIHTGEKPLQCEICGFTCRQKASLNWHRRKHVETAAALRFPCEFCGKRFEKPDSVAAHRSKSHPALQEPLGPTEPCAALSASKVLGSPEGSGPPPAPQAPASVPQQ